MATLASAASPTPHQIARDARDVAATAVLVLEASDPGGLPRAGPTAALATRASSMATTRMTSTPSRRIVTSDAMNAGPNAPTGRASSLAISVSTSVARRLDPRRQLFAP